MGGRAEGVAEVVGPALGGHVVDHEVPLVDDVDAGLVVVGDVVAELLVDLADPLPGVEEHEDHVGASDAAFGAVRAVELEVARNALATSEAGCVDGDERLAVEFEADIDTVASGAGHFADDHPVPIRRGC